MTFQVSLKSRMEESLSEGSVRVDSLLGRWLLDFCDGQRGYSGAILESFLGIMPF